jgi:hypothetical protein
MGKYRNGNTTQPIGIVDPYAFREDGSVPTFPEGLKTLKHGAGIVVVRVLLYQTGQRGISDNRSGRKGAHGDAAAEAAAAIS